jgi:hypothetical protein
MSDNRHEAIVVFGPLDGTDWRQLNRRERAKMLRGEAQKRAKRMLEDLRRAGMTGEVDLLDGPGQRSVPAGAVLVRATPRALNMIRKAKGVAAVADVDTQLPTSLLSI